METVIGSVILSANGAFDQDYLLPCDGRTLRVGDYPQMALAWAATPQDPSSTFTLPDLRPVAPVCQDSRRRLIYSTPVTGYPETLYPGASPLYDDWDVDMPTIGTIARIAQAQAQWGPLYGLLCNGQFLPIKQYINLYDVIGQRFWGAGAAGYSQSLHFRVPNLSTGVTDTVGKPGGAFWICDSGLFPLGTTYDWGTA